MITSSTVRISRGMAKRLQALLNMSYKPSEVAKEMGVNTHTIYENYLTAGAPFEKDKNGRIWIVGDHFAKWALECAVLRSNKPAKVKLEPGQTYCLKCNQVVDIVDPQKSKPNNRGVFNVSGRCGICGGKVNRFCSGSARQV